MNQFQNATSLLACNLAPNRLNAISPVIQIFRLNMRSSDRSCFDWVSLPEPALCGKPIMLQAGRS